MLQLLAHTGSGGHRPIQKMAEHLGIVQHHLLLIALIFTRRAHHTRQAGLVKNRVKGTDRFQRVHIVRVVQRQDITLEIDQIGKVRGAKRVGRHHRMTQRAELPGEIGTDETRTAGDQNPQDVSIVESNQG
jgi:hypothetical protein